MSLPSKHPPVLQPSKRPQVLGPLLAFLLLSLACLVHPPLRPLASFRWPWEQSPPLVHLDYASYRGTAATSQVNSFKGMRFAEPRELASSLSQISSRGGTDGDFVNSYRSSSLSTRRLSSLSFNGRRGAGSDAFRPLLSSATGEVSCYAGWSVGRAIGGAAPVEGDGGRGGELLDGQRVGAERWGTSIEGRGVACGGGE